MLRLLVVFALGLLPPLAPAARADSLLRLYFLPTYPVQLNWGSPKLLIESAINGLIRNRTHAIGHVNVELDCQAPAGESELYGASGAGAGAINQLLMVEQVGLSLLERGWPGTHESRERILESFRIRGKDPRQLAAVSWRIPLASCQRLQRYVREYQAATRPPYYGFAPRPRFREGAGCSAFGASFVELAGLLTEELTRAWTSRRRFPLSLMAGHGGREKVSVNELRSSPDAARWAHAEEPHMDLVFFDPDRMYSWVKELADDPKRLAQLGGEPDGPLPYGISGVPAIRFDGRNVATPEEPLFLGAPSLTPAGPSSMVRSGIRYGGNGSFELRP